MVVYQMITISNGKHVYTYIYIYIYYIIYYNIYTSPFRPVGSLNLSPSLAGCLVLWLHLVFEEACEDHSPGRTMMFWPVFFRQFLEMFI